MFIIFQRFLMSTFLLNVPPNQNFGDAIAVQDLRVEFMNEILSEVPPTKVLEPLLLYEYLNLAYYKLYIEI